MTTQDKELAKRMREGRKQFEEKLAQEVKDGKATVSYFMIR